MLTTTFEQENNHLRKWYNSGLVLKTKYLIIVELWNLLIVEIMTLKVTAIMYNHKHNKRNVTVGLRECSTFHYSSAFMCLIPMHDGTTYMRTNCQHFGDPYGPHLHFALHLEEVRMYETSAIQPTSTCCHHQEIRTHTCVIILLNLFCWCIKIFLYRPTVSSYSWRLQGNLHQTMTIISHHPSIRSINPRTRRIYQTTHILQDIYSWHETHLTAIYWCISLNFAKV